MRDENVQKEELLGNRDKNLCVPVRWHESLALDPGATVWSSRLLVNWGGPCILCSRDFRACIVSGDSGDSGTSGRKTEKTLGTTGPLCIQVEPTRRNTTIKKFALPCRGLVGLALLSPLDSRAILFRANKALPAFCVAKRKRKKSKVSSKKQRLKDNRWSTSPRRHLPLLPG